MDDAKKLKLSSRYLDALHGVQSAVAYEIHVQGLNNSASNSKHLRTGLNGAMADAGSVARLLISKGIFTEEEYLTAIAEGAELELKRYEDRYPGIKFA